MTNTDKAILVLERTHDGDDLAPAHLHLVEAAVNGWLSEKGQQAFDSLLAEVQAGKYNKPWFHGIEHVTNDHEGYVYWKGKRIEHFSYNDFQEEKAGVERFAACCLRLEAAGHEVTLKNYLSDLC